MPYNIINPGSVEDAWNNPQSVFNQAQDNDRQTQAVQQGLLNQTLQNYTGNIDLANRPVVQNPDGSISTVRSMSFNEDGKEVLIPTVSQNGTIMSPQQAIDEYHRTGQHLGLFNNIADANAMARQIHNQQEQMYNTVPGAATQMAAQGNAVARRKPTAAEYEAGVINYLVNNRGYSYEDAQQLMAPRIQAYKVQEAAENRNMADNLIAEMQNMKIDSPEYRQAAFQLYRLDPKMGEFMMKEGISPREQYLRGQKLEDLQTARQQKREDMQFNADMQLRNRLEWLKTQSAYTQQQAANRVNQLMRYAGLDEKSAWLAVLGGGRNGSAAAANTGVSKDDYKRATEGLKALDDEVAEGRLTNPNFQLSPEKQRQYNMLYAVKQRGDNEFFARNGVGQQKQQPTKINFNDYNSLKPALQRLVERNGGKFSKDIARLVRQRAGLDPDNNNPNEFLNIVFKRDYDFSG